jgi:hypothetical protein
MTTSDGGAETRQRNHWDALRQLREQSRSLFEGRALDTQRLAADFGKIGIQTAFLLNGGALAAIPTNMPKLDAVAFPWALHDAAMFVAGLFAAALAVLFAYANYTLLTQAYWFIAEVADHELVKQFYPEIRDTPNDLKNAKRQPILSFFADMLMYLAAVSAVISFMLFALGVFGFIDLAQHHSRGML